MSSEFRQRRAGGRSFKSRVNPIGAKAGGRDSLAPAAGRMSRGLGQNSQFHSIGNFSGSRAIQLSVLPRRRVRLFRTGYQVGKRCLDLFVCAVISVPVFLVMAACAALVLLEDGRPILFTQMRTGRCGRRFKIYKFRTMVKNAEEMKQKLWHLNKMSGPEFKLVDDPRITKVGRFLRKWSLDELPQIINVIKGDMSLVGPRPTSFDASKYALWQTERLEVVPGITGLAQVSGRSELSFEEKLRLDMRYVERRSFLLDIQILIRTAGVLLNSRGAY